LKKGGIKNSTFPLCESWKLQYEPACAHRFHALLNIYWIWGDKEGVLWTFIPPLSVTCLNQKQSRKTQCFWDRWKRQIHFLELYLLGQENKEQASSSGPGCGLLQRWFMSVLPHLSESVPLQSKQVSVVASPVL